MSYPPCPKCGSTYTYEDGWNFVCPECGNEWNDSQAETTEAVVVRDANGNELNDGDKVTVIKDLKLGRDVLKQGAIVRNIKILDEPVNGHDIEARVDGLGAIYLKGSVIKKIS